MPRYIDLSVTVDDTTMSPPSTNMRIEITPHRRGPGFWQVSSVRQSLHTGAHIDSPLHVFKDGITAAELRLDLVVGPLPLHAEVVDLEVEVDRLRVVEHAPGRGLDGEAVADDEARKAVGVGVLDVVGQHDAR